MEEISKVLRPLLPPGYQAVLFGSRADGRHRDSSDWDIGIVGAKPLRGALVERLREALEDLPTLHTFEIVDLSTVPEGFREAALRRAVKIV